MARGHDAWTCCVSGAGARSACAGPRTYAQHLRPPRTAVEPRRLVLCAGDDRRGLVVRQHARRHLTHAGRDVLALPLADRALRHAEFGVEELDLLRLGKGVGDLRGGRTR
eukprot:4006410-Prymnesium_polylepis.1